MSYKWQIPPCDTLFYVCWCKTAKIVCSLVNWENHVLSHASSIRGKKICQSCKAVSEYLVEHIEEHGHHMSKYCLAHYLPVAWITLKCVWTLFWTYRLMFNIPFHKHKKTSKSCNMAFLMMLLGLGIVKKYNLTHQVYAAHESYLHLHECKTCSHY